MPSSPTKPGTQKLSDVARKVVAPDGIASTGWPAVEATCRVRLGVEFDPWQHGAGRLILAKRADGKLAAMIGGIGMSLPRQVGKTYLIGAMAFALCINHPGMLVIWSAHHARTHGETFLSMQAFADRAKVKPYIEQVFKGSGDEEIRFRNGSRILFGARERGFGRGVPGVDMIVSDEAQIMSDKALDAQLATMNTSQFGLAIYIGTPPRPDDPSEAFTRMRSEAWAGTLKDAAWIEFGAAPGVDPDDRSQWRVNPSYPRRTPVESILRLRRKLTPDSFLREGLGVWTETIGSVIPAYSWKRCGDPDAAPLDPVVFAVDVDPNRTRATIAACGLSSDGIPTVEIIVSEPGTDWVVAKMVELNAERPAAFVIDRGSPAGALLSDLADKRLPLQVCGARDMTQACGQFYDAVVGETFRHRNERPLSAAVENVRKRNVGEAWAWARKDTSADITPLYAATLALWGHRTYGRRGAPRVLTV